MIRDIVVGMAGKGKSKRVKEHELKKRRSDSILHRSISNRKKQNKA